MRATLEEPRWTGSAEQRLGAQRSCARAGASTGGASVGSAAIAAYLVATLLVAQSSLNVQSLVLVAAVFGILAISLDLVAGMLGLYSLGQAGFFAIGAYLDDDRSPRTTSSTRLPAAAGRPRRRAASPASSLAPLSLRVSGLYFAITTFIFTLVLTVLATDLKITRRHPRPAGADFPGLSRGASQSLGAPVAWCSCSLLLAHAVASSGAFAGSPLYPVLLSIRDAEPFARGRRRPHLADQDRRVRHCRRRWREWRAGCSAFLGVVSPGQFDWAVSLNILVMVLVGGINTTLGPLIGAAFVTMFPAVVNINPWLQEVLYGASSILAITVFPEGVVGLVKRRLSRRPSMRSAQTASARCPDSAIGAAERPAFGGRDRRRGTESPVDTQPRPRQAVVVECRGIDFGYGVGPKGAAQRRSRGQARSHPRPDRPQRVGQKHACQYHRRAACGRMPARSIVDGTVVDRLSASGRARLGLRRTFQAAQLVRELTPARMCWSASTRACRVSSSARGILAAACRRAGARRRVDRRVVPLAALRCVGAGDWTDRRVRDVPHGIEQLTQLASVCVAEPDIIILDEPATGLSTPRGRASGDASWPGSRRVA